MKESATGAREPEQLRKMGKWTRTYAQNRAFLYLVPFVLFALFFAAISGFSSLSGQAYRSSHMIRFGICLTGLVLALGALFWFSFRGGRLVRAVSDRLYGTEGSVVPTVPPGVRPKSVVHVVAAVFAFCVLASVSLGMAGYLSEKWMLPLSAAYGVPFMVFLVLWQRPCNSLLMLLWPLLYAIHAALYLAGVQIPFVGKGLGPNMYVCVFGYGLTTIIISHLYSRLALRKIRRLAGTGPELSEGEHKGAEDERS